MDFFVWLSVVTFCALAAMSPGPSAAMIVHVTTRHGRRAGLAAACAHGVGVGCYAMLAVLGLATVITQSALLSGVMHYGGGALLGWFGLRALGFFATRPSGDGDAAAGTMSEATDSDSSQSPATHWQAAGIGLGTALLNPKVAVFFLALFSQFAGPADSAAVRFLLAGTATVIDSLWYVVVAFAVAQPRWRAKLQPMGTSIQKVFGILLLLLAAHMILA